MKEYKLLYAGVVLYFALQAIAHFCTGLIYMPLPLFPEYAYIILIMELIMYVALIWITLFKIKAHHTITWWMVLIILALYFFPNYLLLPHFTINDFAELNKISDYEKALKALFNTSIFLIAYIKYRKALRQN